jgi:pimeloyl-ACP methyl ester carboxylesterase
VSEPGDWSAGDATGSAPPPAAVGPARTRVWRRKDWARPVRPAAREVRTAVPVQDDGVLPPLLFVHDARDAQGAEVFAEPWLARAAERGHLAVAVSLRGRGGTAPSGHRSGVALREWVHDAVQEAVALPRRAVLIGCGTGALVVAHALTRYPAAAGALLAPAGLPGARAAGWGLLLGAPRLGTALLLGRAPEVPPERLPVLVGAVPGDRRVPAKTLDRLAVRYRAQALRLPGHPGPALPAAVEPLDAVLDWLATATLAGSGKPGRPLTGGPVR